jgi:acyl-CoA synthetase (AMP-forming)/AMP-acid ligase II
MDLSQLSAVHNFLEENARLRPDKVAFVQDDQRVSYGQINAMANRLAVKLLENGVVAGDRIVMLLENSLEYIVSYYGVLKTGGVAVPLNCELKSESLCAVLRELQPRVVISCCNSEQLLRDVEPDGLKIPLMVIKNPSQGWRSSGCEVIAWENVVQEGDLHDPGIAILPTSLASIIYTSGSTGKPKGVMLSHRNIISNTDSIVQYLNLTEKDIQMVVLPFFYVMGKSLLNTHFAVGGTVVVNNSFAYPASVIRQMAAERVTGFSGVPSTYAYLLHRSPLFSFRDRLESLRYCTQAGGHMSREIKEKLLRALPSHTRLYIMYGATEAAARLTYVEPERLASKFESIGRAIPGVTVRVLDEKGQEVPTGEPGELVASGPNIMQGYWRDASGTARVLDENGYHTGDMGYRDEDGYLYVTGRKDDLLKVGGHRIDPQEIEDALMATGLLLEVAVVGVEDQLLGKRLVAVAVPLSGEPSESSILALCLARLPRHKVPSRIRFVASLPKYSNSKIDRAGCLALIQAG